MILLSFFVFCISYLFFVYFFYFSFLLCILRYGDKAPHGTVAKLFAVFWIMLGITIFNMYTAAITSVLTTQLASANSDTLLYMQKVGKSVVIKNCFTKLYHLRGCLHAKFHPGMKLFPGRNHPCLWWNLSYCLHVFAEMKFHPGMNSSLSKRLG